MWSCCAPCLDFCMDSELYWITCVCLDCCMDSELYWITCVCGSWSSIDLRNSKYHTKVYPWYVSFLHGRLPSHGWMMSQTTCLWSAFSWNIEVDVKWILTGHLRLQTGDAFTVDCYWLLLSGTRSGRQDYASRGLQSTYPSPEEWPVRVWAFSCLYLAQQWVWPVSLTSMLDVISYKWVCSNIDFDETN